MSPSRTTYFGAFAGFLGALLAGRTRDGAPPRGPNYRRVQQIKIRPTSSIRTISRPGKTNANPPRPSSQALARARWRRCFAFSLALRLFARIAWLFLTVFITWNLSAKLRAI
jgi:hypothetical protein